MAKERSKVRGHDAGFVSAYGAKHREAERAGSKRGEGAGRKILVIDVGGTHVKVLATGQRVPRKVLSGRTMTAAKMVKDVKEMTRDWKYDVISIGYPGPVVLGKALHEPCNLGAGWVGFDFRKAFGKPVKVVNDAAMQALGSYRGGRMLFLGLGTGLGSAMVVDGIVQPMELAHLPYKKGKTYEDYVGLRGLERLGKKKWRKHVEDVVERLRAALEPDYIVLGGGNVKKLKKLPEGAERGDNENAFRGGFRLWSTEQAEIPARWSSSKQRQAGPRISCTSMRSR